MKFLLYVAIIVTTFYGTSGQSSTDRLYCYSCSATIGNVYGRSNIDCLSNVTAVRSVRCSRGYYCLTSYTVQSGVVTYIRRTCQNPQTDHNQVKDAAPTQDGCVSRHSRSSSSSDSTSCYFHCTTSRCNKITPGNLQQCPDSCPSSCDVITGECVTPLRCVQCTTESDQECEKKTTATLCPRTSYNYCAATTTTVLTLDKVVIQTSVSKSCTTFSSSYSIPTEPCKFVASSTRSSSNYIKYACSKFCSTDGCNMKAPVGSPIPEESDGLRCVVCFQAGIRGSGCSTLTRTTKCPPSSTHCKATVSYYTSPLQSQYGQPIYKLAFIRRECSKEPVTTQCLPTDVPDVNLKYVSCQETCQTNGCNTGWPARPKCGQCDATNRTYTRRQFANCQNTPFRPRRCASPVYAYCTTISNNTASDPDFSRRVKRGCSITDIGTRCYDIPAGGGKTIQHCQSSCSTSGCNQDPILT